MGCVKKLTNALQAIESNIEIVDISTQRLTVNTTASLADITASIEQLGYQARPANTVHHFSLTGLNCGKCVAKLTEHLQQLHSPIIQINKRALIIESSLDDKAIIDHVQQLGFGAQSVSEHSLQQQVQTDPSPSIDLNFMPLSNNDNGESIQLLIQGMTCASCVASVEKAIKQVPQVKSASVNLAEQSAIVYLTTEHGQDIESQLIQATAKAGYQAEVVTDLTASQQQQQLSLQQHQTRQKRNTIIALTLGAPLMLWGMFGGNMMIRNPQDQVLWGLVGLLCLWVLATAGKSFYSNAFSALKHKRATMDSLVALGTGAAWFYSMLIVITPNWFPLQSRHVYFEASAMIIGLISLGHYIEAKAKTNTNRSLQALMKLQPTQAWVIIEGREQSMDIQAIKLGMQLLIKPGEKVPVDGVVIEGESYIDESMLTGEPLPSHKTVSNLVSAGTINTHGRLIIKATSIGSQTMLSRIIRLVREAQSSKPAIAKLADSISAIFVPIVIAIALLSAGIWYAVGPEPTASYMLIVTTTVLIIACPCALGLATPLSVTVGIGKAAQSGILIKEADALQNLTRVKAVIFDKTGTLTQGTPKVVKVWTFDASEQEIAACAVTLERLSQHPLAEAIVRHWPNVLTTDSVEQFRNLDGKGVEGTIKGQHVTIASVNHIKSLGYDTCLLSEAIEASQALTATPVVVIIEQQIKALIAIADTVKPESKAAIQELSALGIKSIMLTGDNQNVADTIASQLGIDQVIAEVLPDQKAHHIQSLKKQYQYVAMVGDGINDAPALALADVGIAMGSGSDIAIETASMTLLNSNPQNISYAIALSKATVKNIKQNLFGAFIYNTLSIPIAAGVLYPVFGFLLSPVVAGAAMALSSITVVLNANRLKGFSASKQP